MVRPLLNDNLPMAEWQRLRNLHGYRVSDSVGVRVRGLVGADAAQR
jgi:uncharacterized protein YggE